MPVSTNKASTRQHLYPPMGSIVLVSPPETPPRSNASSPMPSSSTRRLPQSKRALRCLPVTVITIIVGVILLGSGAWPYRDQVTEGWMGPAVGSASSALSRWTGLVPLSQDDVSTTDTGLNDDSLDFRRQLERTTSPPGFLTHHRTLGFSHIYVLSLPHREDRRATMRKLAAALGVDITFLDGTPKHAGVIGWISERAAEVRILKRRAIANHLGISEHQIGGLGVGSLWLTRSRGGGLGNQDALKDIVFDSLARTEYDGLDWVQYLWSTDPGKLKPSDSNFNVTEAMWDPLERISERQVNPATISTYYNHLRVLRLMKENKDESALVLEDDVDVEWDLERRWRTMQRRLPTDWETVFLGHCWGREVFAPQYLHPNLHKSTAPLCLHGYAVSRRGYNHLLSLYDDPWLAFQTPVDTCVPTWISAGLNAFSVEPQVVIQAKADASDIQLGKGSSWRGLLADSTLERVWKAEGIPVDPPMPNDPATIYRFRKPATIPGLDAPFMQCHGGKMPGTKGPKNSR